MIRDKLMWDIYNAHGADGGEDVLSVLQKTALPLHAQVKINDWIKSTGFHTPLEISDFMLTTIDRAPKLKIV